MNILLTGVSGYIGKRLLYPLLIKGHHVTCCVRRPESFTVPEEFKSQVDVVGIDFSEKFSDVKTDKTIDAAYYLMHSLNSSTSGYMENEKNVAKNFRRIAESIGCKQVIYLGGIANQADLSEHLASRMAVEKVLKGGLYNTTILRAGIIVGSGSASFEIIRDLVEKLPLMITPRWVNTLCQPIAVHNVIQYLEGVLGNEKAYNNTFDIGGPDILSYKQMMLQFAKTRGLRRWIYTIPVMTPRISSYWLYFITSTNYTLAVNLVKSMRIEVIAGENNLQDIYPIDLISYSESIRMAFSSIDSDIVLSSWIDSVSSFDSDYKNFSTVAVPENGCFIDKREVVLSNDIEKVQKKLWSIGGKNGWYSANFLWNARGLIDKLKGGVGLRRGRRNQHELNRGDALDFWRVLEADKESRRLLLFAEMRLPGEAWLEFKIDTSREPARLIQTATFRPKGLNGRLYWYSIVPLHSIVFRGMIRSIAKG
jgi:uncharacterized protein YbjT (DUF2867 family)